MAPAQRTVVSPVKELDWEGKVAHISGGKIGELTQKLSNTADRHPVGQAARHQGLDRSCGISGDNPAFPVLN